MQFLFQPNKLHFNKKNPLLLGLEPGLPAEQVLLAIVKSLFLCNRNNYILWNNSCDYIILNDRNSSSCKKSKVYMYNLEMMQVIHVQISHESFLSKQKKKKIDLTLVDDVSTQVLIVKNVVTCLVMCLLILEEAIVYIFNPHTTNYLHFSRCFLRAEILETKAFFF